jgi:hypothetical protein
MKEIKIIQKLFAILIVTLGLGSCLKKADMNIDPDKTTANIVTLQFIENGSGSTINSGMQYFSGGALTYSASHDADTADYNVNLAGPTTLGGDLNVTVAVDPTKVLDNYASDSIPYELMPDSLYHLVSTTATVKAGERIAHMQVIFYPSKINPTKSYMLPLVVKDASGQTISANYSTIYFHVIGNPIAGAYNWDFYRYNNLDGTGAPAGGSFLGDVTVFSPVNPTQVKVPTGYYVQPNFLITFKNTNGVLSDFTAVIAPDELKGAYTDNGITIVAGPFITVSPDYKTITVKHTVFNGSAYRNCTDIYYK